MTDNIKLTDFARASGCGCKIHPKALEEILKDVKDGQVLFPNLLVGNDKGDDAAVWDMGDGKALISTTDFFTPIVNSPYDFGFISAVNAINDIYAMGGTPLMGLAILGWPVDDLPLSMAGVALQGARDACKEAGIPLAGGHSIDSKEPFLGLSANGLVDTEHIKRNSDAKSGDRIYLTKPIGTGVLSAAEKRGKLRPEDEGLASTHMKKLNKVGSRLGKLDYVHAMTDVTGFGLLGHLIEMCEGAGLSAKLNMAAMPVIEAAKHYIAMMCYPDGTLKNWSSYTAKVKLANAMDFLILADPQTSGGLMVAVSNEAASDFEAQMDGEQIWLIGDFVEKGEVSVWVD